MRIATVIKHVPDSSATIKVSAGGDGIELAGVKMVLDPFDEFGVELAIQLRERRGDVSEIVLFTLGPDKAREGLRTALAMGADRAVHINDAKFESHDELFAASVIAAAIQAEPEAFDLVLCGKYTIDLDAGAVGPALGEYLGWPHVGAVTGLEFSEDGSEFTARRRIEGAEEVVECQGPAVLTIEKGLVEPRYPSLPNLMKAKKKTVTVLTSVELAGAGSNSVGMRLESMSPPPPKPECKFIEGEPAEMARELIRLLREEAKAI